MKEGGASRVIFRLQVEVEKLEVEFNYESATAPPLGAAYVERLTFCLGVHPTSIVIDASLGNMKAVDGALPEVRFSHRLSMLHATPFFKKNRARLRQRVGSRCGGTLDENVCWAMMGTLCPRETVYRRRRFPECREILARMLRGGKPWGLCSL